MRGRSLLGLLLWASCAAPAPVVSVVTAAAPTAGVRAATPPPDPPPPAFRLPGDVVPVRYGLELTIVPEADRADGVVRIATKVVRPTRVVWLDARGLEITHAWIDDHAVRIVPGGEQFVGLASDLATGEHAIKIEFRAAIDHEKSRGIYAEKEGDATYAYTFFEAIDARRAFPCFDEPSYKVPWQLTFHIKADQLARGNAAVVSERAEPNGMKRVELAETKPLPSYLVAFVVGPFDDIDGGTGGRVNTPIHFLVPKGHANELGYAKQITPKVVAALESYFDMDYPFGKLDVAVVPRFWGTMEHPGIVAMGQPLTLIRPDQATRDRKEAYTNILAHELGHYWFGDLVTMAWWDDTFLNEALGQWLDMRITDAAEPSWHFLDQRVDRTTSAMPSDETLSAHPIEQLVTTNEAIETSFDGALTYNKGSTVLRQLEMFVGEAKWQAFLRGYLRKHAGGNASAGDFVGEMRAALGAPAADAFELYITRPGVPLANVRAECKPSPQLVLAPMPRALPAGVQAATEDQPVFRVPVCVRYGDGHHSETACSTGDAIPVTFCPTWILPNAGGYGYYRSHVELAGALALLQPGHVAKPTVPEKLMLVADLAAMVKRDELPIDQALPLVAQLARDPDPKFAVAADEVAPLQSAGFAEPLYEASRAWSVKIYAPLAKRLGWHRRAGDSDDLQRLRGVALRHVASLDPTTRRQAEQLADRWTADRTGLDDDLVGTALSAAAYKGDAARFARYVAVAKHPRDASEARRLLAAIGAFTAPELVERAQAMVLARDLDLRDTQNILWSQLALHETRVATLRFLEAHLDELLARMRDDEASWLLGAVAGAFCDATHRAAAAKLLVPRAAKIDGAQNSVTRGLELADHCIAEVARELPALHRFFKI